MSAILNSRERELTSLLKQKESELKQANAELVSFSHTSSSLLPSPDVPPSD